MNHKFQVAKAINDKYDDGWMPTKRDFAHDNYEVSGYLNRFHTASCYHYPHRGRGYPVGVQNKVYRVSASGYRIDAYNNGQSDS